MDDERKTSIFESKPLDKWDERYIKLARHIGSWSSCLSRQNGAIIVKNRCVISTGYNGAATGEESCKEIGECYKRSLGFVSGEGQEACKAVHSEMNAICQAAEHGASISGATLYTNTSPCIICARLIVQAKISRVVYESEYTNRQGLEFLIARGIEVVKYEEPKPENRSSLSCWTGNIEKKEPYDNVIKNCGNCSGYDSCVKE